MYLTILQRQPLSEFLSFGYSASDAALAYTEIHLEHLFTYWGPPSEN